MWMPEEQAKGFMAMLSKSIRPGVQLKTHRLNDAELPNLDVIGRTSTGVHLISPWNPQLRVLKENKHSLPTSRATVINQDLNPAPSLAEYRNRVRTMLLRAQQGKLPTDIANRRDNAGRQVFVNPATQDTLAQDLRTGQLVTGYRRRFPTPTSAAPGEFIHWWDRL